MEFSSETYRAEKNELINNKKCCSMHKYGFFEQK
jgi:hypothetical protein